MSTNPAIAIAQEVHTAPFFLYTTGQSEKFDKEKMIGIVKTIAGWRAW